MSAVRMSNEMPGLESFFHPVALSDEVCDGATYLTELLGQRWKLTRHRGVVHTVDDEAGGLVERHGLVWLAPEPPLADVIDFPEWDDSCFDAWYLQCRRTPVSAALLIDNFVDAGHFPFLHRATFGAEDPGTPDLETHRDGWHLQVVNRGQPNSGPNYGTLEALQVYELQFPFSLRIVVTLAGGQRNCFLFFLQPESDTSTRLYLGLAYDDTHGDPALLAEVSAFNNRVYDEDFALLATYEDPRIPLDVRAEVHTKADLGTLEFRRMLIERCFPTELGAVAGRAGSPRSTAAYPAA